MNTTVATALCVFCLLRSLPAFDKTETLTQEALDTYQVSSGGVTLNNFVIKEENAMLAKGLRNLKVSYAARNKNADSKAVVIMLVGLAGDEILWSFNVNPAFYTLSENDNETCEGEIFVPPGTLKRTTKIWIRIVGDF